MKSSASKIFFIKKLFHRMKLHSFPPPNKKFCTSIFLIQSKQLFLLPAISRGGFNQLFLLPAISRTGFNQLFSLPTIFRSGFNQLFSLPTIFRFYFLKLIFMPPEFRYLCV